MTDSISMVEDSNSNRTPFDVNRILDDARFPEPLRNSLLAVKNDFADTKIRFLQLDPFGFCNSKCWFCPVKYLGNPDSGKVTMSVELLRRILDNIEYERDKPDGVISPDLNGMYTAHYNEVLLYKHFDTLCQELSQRKLPQMILSNGFTLTPNRTDTIAKFRNAVSGICLNIPAFNSRDWSVRTGFDEKYFDTLVTNVRYAIEILHNLPQKLEISIQVNGINTNSLTTLSIGADVPEFDINTDLDYQMTTARSLFPEASVFSQYHLVDRVGLLPNSVLNNKLYLHRNRKPNAKVIGCSNTFSGGKGRPFDWLHINAAGKVILCCNDYNFEHIVGDLSVQRLADFWGKDSHIVLIANAYNKFCCDCTSAVYE